MKLPYELKARMEAMFWGDVITHDNFTVERRDEGWVITEHYKDKASRTVFDPDSTIPHKRQEEDRGF
jgi:hypothetical protein